jgi:hypothetical protein
VVGAPVRVASDADDAACEAARQTLEAELDRVSARALALADRRDGTPS